MKKYPIMYTVVEVAVLDLERGRILVGQKKIDKDKWRLPGGFTDPLKDQSFEEAAERELFEEVQGIEIIDFITADYYLGSKIIKDDRYKNEDRICSMFYYAIYYDGDPVASDDLDNVKWIDATAEEAKNIIENHQENFKIAVNIIQLYKQENNNEKN